MSFPEPSQDTTVSDTLIHRRARDLPPPPSPRRIWIRRILLAAAALAVLLAIALTITAIILRCDLHASLPQNEGLLDGTVPISGLTSPVTITRNAQDVPSIHASNLDDLLFAQGYITASDRLFQMDTLRRHGAGTLAEILGPSLVQHDREQRILQLRATADRAAAALSPDQLHQLQAYARGVNAYITTHSNTLPIEFHILHYTPALWQPRDSLLIALVMDQDLTTDFPTKLNREALSAHLPSALLADLYPTGSWRDHPPTQDAPNLTTPSAPIEQIPLDRTQSSVAAPPEIRHLDRSPRLFADAVERPLYFAAAHEPKPVKESPTTPAPNKNLSSSPQDLLRISADLTNHRCDGCRAGSNNWVVAGAHTATGAPLLSNDMHLGLTDPDIWYEAALHITPPTDAASTPAVRAGLDVEGFTLPGIPFVIVGRNPFVAWGFTNSGADVQDVLIEHLRGSGNQTEYELPDHTWAPVTHHLEHIRVRAGHDVTLDVLTTTHTIGSTLIQTPIISPLYPTEHRALALAWNIYDPSTLNSPFLSIDAATDAASLVAAAASFGGASQNLIYADAHHIGYHLLGRIPIRGPAIQHPRNTQPLILPTTPPNTPANEADTNDESGDTQPESSPAPPIPNASTQLPSAPTTGYTIGSPLSPIPVDALDPTQAWSGYIPYDQLPATQDPTSGILATANARITPDIYPYAITLNWADPYRVERIHHLLENRNQLTPADMLRIQTDTHSEFDLLVAQRLAYALDHSALTHRDPRLQQAANLLRDWNGDVSLNSTAAAITAAVEPQLWPMLLLPQIRAHDNPRAHDHNSLKPPPSAQDSLKPPPSPLDIIRLYTWSESRTALEQLLQNTPTRWLPPTFANWNDFLATAVERGLRSADAPRNLSTFTYGPHHPIQLAHPVFGSYSPLTTLLGVPTGTGRHPNSGDATTIKAAGLHFGPSERFTADLSNPDNTQANITTGESGNPASPWYLDQFQPWLQGTTYTLPLNHPTIQHTLTLTPQ